MLSTSYIFISIMKHIAAWLSLLSLTKVALGFQTGEPHSTVQTLNKHNFDQALNDPANGLWLLKFYGMCSMFNVVQCARVTMFDIL
jgi:hypothetical protein